MEPLLTIKEFSAQSRLKDGTTRSWISQRKLKVVRLGRRVLIPLSELERIIKEGTQERIVIDPNAFPPLKPRIRLG